METTRDGRPCKACYSYEDMVRMAGKQADAKQRQTAANNSSSASASTSNKAAECSQQNGQGRQRRHDCPVDKDELGRFVFLNAILIFFIFMKINMEFAAHNVRLLPG